MKKVLTTLFILNLLVIWINSALPATLSHTLSDWLVYGTETAFEGDVSGETASRETSSATSSATSSVPSIESKISDAAKERLNNSEWTDELRTFIRKMAHALEFFTLGVLALLVLGAVGGWHRWERLAAVGLATALIDETIQIFSKRTSVLSDVWLDMAGFAAGALLAAGVAALVARRRAKRQ